MAFPLPEHAMSKDLTNSIAAILLMDTKSAKPLVRTAANSTSSPVTCRTEVVCGGDSADQNVVTPCAQWLAVDAEIEHLTLKWATLDASVIRDGRAIGAPASQSSPLKKSAELGVIERRLRCLNEKREQCLSALQEQPTPSLHGLASKLAVAARSLDREGGPIHRIVADAVAVLGTYRCSACGELYLPPACRYPKRPLIAQ